MHHLLASVEVVEEHGLGALDAVLCSNHVAPVDFLEAGGDVEHAINHPAAHVCCCALLLLYIFIIIIFIQKGTRKDYGRAITSY